MCPSYVCGSGMAKHAQLYILILVWLAVYQNVFPVGIACRKQFYWLGHIQGEPEKKVNEILLICGIIFCTKNVKDIGLLYFRRCQHHIYTSVNTCLQHLHT